MILMLLLVGVAALAFVSLQISRQAERRYPPVGQMIEVPGGRLHVVDRPAQGAAVATVLLVHGASSNHADLLAALGPSLGRYRIIAPDRPGQGWSERLGGREMADPGRQAQALVAMLDKLKAGPVIIVAHSLGGGVAMELALHHTSHVKGVVLLGAVTHPWPGGISWYYHPAAAAGMGEIFNRLVAIPAGYAMLKTAVAGVFAPRPVAEGYIEAGKIPLLFRPAAFRANAEDVNALYDAVVRLSPHYPELTVPVIAFHGLDDTVTYASLHSEPLPAESPLARFVPLPGVGHMAHYAVPGEIAAAVDRLAQP